MTQNNSQHTQPLLAQYEKTPELSVQSIFRLRPEELQLLFKRDHMKKPSEDNAGERRESLIILEKVNWHHGLLQDLATDAETGIIGDVKDLQRRKKFFGQNERSLPSVRSFLSILWDQFDEYYVLVLLVLATILLFLSFKSEKELAWVEAVSIYFAVAFAASIQTLCDWGKERQFLRLRKEIANQKVTVLRGQYGTTQNIFVSELVVGDVIMLEAGDRVPADCLLIEEMDMHVDQRMYNLEDDLLTQRNEGDAQRDYTEKQCSYQEAAQDASSNPDNLLLQESIVMQGSGKAVVLCVGKRTLREVELSDDTDKLKIEDVETPYQAKLKTFSEVVGFYAQVVGYGSLVLFGIVWLFTCMFTSGLSIYDGVGLEKLVNFAIISMSLLIVCIPEGMPLVISMAMAFSVDSLQEEHLLIKNLDALETSGQLVDILTGKTATLTEGDLIVGHLHIIGMPVDPKEPAVNNEVMSILYQCMILNTDAHLQMGEQEYAPHGNPVDVGLMNLLVEHNQDVQEKLVQREREYKLVCQIPFSSYRKCRTVAFELPNEGIVRVVVKGAPEVVVPNCENVLDQNSDVVSFHDREGHLEDVVSKAIAKTGMKPLSIAYRDFPTADFEDLKASNGNFETEESRKVIEEDLTLVATFGFVDALRPGVQQACQDLMDCGTNVRIISGDHKDAAISVANELGLLALDDDTDSSTMSGAELKQHLLDILISKDDTEEGRGKTWDFNSTESKKVFKKDFMSTLRVVYRADPDVKHMFTAAIRAAGSMVGVTGEGLNDARALSEASVGFAMGQDGCAAAKDHADIILTDDNFVSVINAIRWGRNIQDNTRKFVQYQMTVNFSCIFFVVFSILTVGFSPFSVIQLLWINLVMDVLAAIAFATEHPHPTELRQERIKKSNKIMTPLMWRAVTSQALYQFLVMIVLLFWGPAMFGIKYEFYPEASLRTEEGPSYRLQHQTFLFMTFMWMNFFNMFNCRALGKMPVGDEDQSTADSRREINAFARLFDNWWFAIVLLAEINLQFAMVQYKSFGIVFMTTPLTWGMHLTAFLVGASCLAVAIGVKYTPEKLLKKFPEVNEDESFLKAQRERVSSLTSQMEQYENN